MGNLKTGATYVYEKSLGITYAREMGAPPDSRIEIGRDYYPDSEPKVLGMPLKKVAVLIDMANQAEHNTALRDALDRAIVIYELSRRQETAQQSEPQTIQHHSV